jgi:hypothetical protein
MDIYVDGCDNKTIGACATVTDKNGSCLISLYSDFLSRFKFLDSFEKLQYKNRILYKVNFEGSEGNQNNGCEMLSMVVGLLIALFYNIKNLHSDSDLMIKWWSKEAKKPIENKKKSDLRVFCIILANIFRNNGGTIHKVDGGTNPADVGFHIDKPKKYSRL